MGTTALAHRRWKLVIKMKENRPEKMPFSGEADLCKLFGSKDVTGYENEHDCY